MELIILIAFIWLWRINKRLDRLEKILYKSLNIK